MSAAHCSVHRAVISSWSRSPVSMRSRISRRACAITRSQGSAGSGGGGTSGCTGNCREGRSRRACCLSNHCVIWSARSEEHTSELQSLMRISYAVFCLKKKKQKQGNNVRSLAKVKNNEQLI